MVAILVGMAFAAVPMYSVADDPSIVAPSVTKSVSPTDISFGSINTKTTVTIEVTGAGGTSSTITPMDVVFAIDSSGSMGWNDGSDLRLDAAAYFLDQMDDSRDTAGVVSWDYYIDFAKGLWSDFDDTDGIEYWIYQTDAYGGTNLNVGLNEAIDMLDDNSRTGASSEVIIFLTDGQGTYTSAADGGPAAEAATSGYVIYSIGLGSSASSTALEDMANATGGEYYSSASASNLQDIYDDIYGAIVTSTQPHDVQVVEITESYITGHSNFNIAPDSVTTAAGGKTTIIWNNVGQWVGDYDTVLSASETVTFTFQVGANKPGYHMGVQDYGNAKVNYENGDGDHAGSVLIPQAYINVAQTANLIADGGDEYLDVGDVTIWQDATNVYVKYVTTGGWEMTETHLHVDDAVADIPQNKKGNPKIGKFDYSNVHSPAVTEYTYTIPWSLSSGDILYIAAHAVVRKETGQDDEGNPIYREETAWGEGTGFNGNSWAMYIKYEDP
jgi:Ca-activated chloride channel family protein